MGNENPRRVSVTACPDYTQAAAALATLLEPWGGMGAFIRPGQQVCLKVNLLRISPPETAVTTHPAVVKAVALAVRDAGGFPFLADSPGGGLPYTRAVLERAYKITGYTALAEEIDLALNLDTSSREVCFEEAKITRRFNVITPVLEAGAVINLCKLKTHAFTYLTGAVKNLFGVIPGYDKPGYHGRLQQVDYFAEMLLDVALFIKPVLNIMDAVTAMEGNGPGLGDPRPVGLLLASGSPLALDVAAGVLTGLPPEKHPIVRAAAGRGLQPGKPGEVEFTGRPLAAIPDWKWPPTLVSEHGFVGYGGAGALLSRIFREGYSIRPRVQAAKCTGCGLCREACPAGAIEIINGQSYIEDKMCIRCYCCHEACPEDAIELKRGMLNRLLNRRA